MPSNWQQNSLWHICRQGGVSVAERFKDTSTNEIIEISHKEKAWIDNIAEKKLIDYNYSFELNF